MNPVKVLFQLFLLYLLYKFITGLIWPLFKASKQMNERMARAREEESLHNPVNPVQENKAPKAGDYIEFEEVKP